MSDDLNLEWLAHNAEFARAREMAAAVQPDQLLKLVALARKGRSLVDWKESAGRTTLALLREEERAERYEKALREVQDHCCCSAFAPRDANGNCSSLRCVSVIAREALEEKP